MLTIFLFISQLFNIYYFDSNPNFSCNTLLEQGQIIGYPCIFLKIKDEYMSLLKMPTVRLCQVGLFSLCSKENIFILAFPWFYITSTNLPALYNFNIIFTNYLILKNTGCPIKNWDFENQSKFL